MKTAFCLLLLSFGSYLPNLNAQSTAQPNIIFIVLDDLNDFVGYLEGHPQLSTPAIDRLSEKGVSFTNAYANSPLCAPSRTSFLTGKSNEYTQVFENDAYTTAVNNGTGKFRALFDSTQYILTLPEFLKDSAGYFTYGLGKVFNGWYSITKNDNDFDSLSTDPCLRQLSWNAFNDFPTSTTAVPVDSVVPYYQGVTTFRFSTIPNSLESEMEDTDMVDAALSFIDQYESSPADFCDRPFFLALGVHKPHAPRYIPQRYFSAFYKPNLTVVPYDVPYNEPINAWPPNGFPSIALTDPPYADFDALGPFAQRLAIGVGGHLNFDTFPYIIDDVPVIDPALDSLSRFKIISESKRALAVMAYNASVSYADYQIFRVLEKLDSHPALKENTVIILTSDHGHAVGEKKHWRKGALWDTDLRIPLIIVDPRSTAEGQQNSSPVSLLDIFPTVCELAGIPEPKMPDGTVYSDGRSLRELVETPSISWNSTVVSSVSLPLSTPVCHNPLYSVYNDEFHYLHYEWTYDPNCHPDSITLEEELYHLGKNRTVDPNEWVNLAADPAYRQVKNYLRSHLPGNEFSLAYSKQLPSLRIKTDSLPCTWTAGDSLKAEVEWLNTKGQVVPNSPSDAFEVCWFVNGDTAFADDSIVNLTPVADSLGRWILELTLSDSLGRVCAMDRLELQGLGLAIDPNFEISSIDSFTVALSADLSLTTPGLGNFESQWDWGDLSILTEDYPAPHSYRSPGNYTISHQLISTSEKYAHCVWQADTSIYISDTVFGDDCLTPLPLNLLALSADRFKVNWHPVQNANSYDLRFKKFGQRFNNWFSGNTSDTVAIPGPLAAGKQWEVSMRAICSSDTSDWSWPVVFRNPECRSPGVPNPISITSHDIYFDWQESPDASLGYDLLLRESASANRFFNVPAGSTDFLIPGLNSSTGYQLFIRSRCTQVNLGAYEASKAVFTFFNSAALLLPKTAQLESEAVLQLTPNPATSFVRISNLPEVSNYTKQHDLSIYLLDANGRVVLARQIPAAEAAATDVIELNIATLPAGNYQLQAILGESEMRSGKLVIQ